MFLWVVRGLVPFLGRDVQLVPDQRDLGWRATVGWGGIGFSYAPEPRLHVGSLYRKINEIHIKNKKSLTMRVCSQV